MLCADDATDLIQQGLFEMEATLDITDHVASTLQHSNKQIGVLQQALTLEDAIVGADVETLAEVVEAHADTLQSMTSPSQNLSDMSTSLLQKAKHLGMFLSH